MPQQDPARRSAPRRMPLRHRIVGTAAAVTGVLASSYLGVVPGGPSAGRPEAAATAPAGDERPNIILITSDDQNDSDMRYMPLTRRLLGDAGVRVSGFISPDPLCCPARAEIMTGEYGHNNGVRYNEGPFGGYRAFLDRDANVTGNIGTWMFQAGYRTAMVGKFLNQYESSPVRLPGWDRWNPTTGGIYTYYNTTFENDGAPVTYPDTYVADVVTDYTNAYIDEFTDPGEPRRPFFIWASHVGPHNSIPLVDGVLGPIPAVRHRGMYQNLVLPQARKPSFLEADRSDKASFTRRRPVPTLAKLTRTARLRAESLQAIDESVASIVAKLDAVGELDNTLIAFTSDNGYFLGEHRVTSKNLPYEENLDVPMLVRGPGLPAGVTLDQPLTTVDLAPTFLARAGVLDTVRASGRTDGIDMYPVLRGLAAANPTQLIQAGESKPYILAQAGWLFRGVRTGRYTYVRWFNGEEELFDNRLDPYQLRSVDAGIRYRPVLIEMRQRARALVRCAGVRACKQRVFGPEPRPRNVR